MRDEQHQPHPHKPMNINALLSLEHVAAGFNTQLAVGITRAFGSIWAFYILIVWMLVWMALASAGVWLFANDKYPFSFLLFLSNLVQLWALPVLAVGQSVLGRRAELQADEQYRMTQKMCADNATIIAQNNALLALLQQPAPVDKPESPFLGGK